MIPKAAAKVQAETSNKNQEPRNKNQDLIRI